MGLYEYKRNPSRFYNRFTATKGSHSFHRRASVGVGQETALANDFQIAFTAIAPLKKVINVGTGAVTLQLDDNLGEIVADQVDTTGSVVVGDAVLTNNIRGNGANEITVDDNLKVTGNTVLEGNLNIGINNLVCGDLIANGIYGTAAVQIQNMISAAIITANNPHWVAGVVDGTTLNILATKGQWVLLYLESPTTRWACIR